MTLFVSFYIYIYNFFYILKITANILFILKIIKILLGKSKRILFEK